MYIRIGFRNGTVEKILLNHNHPFNNQDDWDRILVEGVLGQNGHQFYNIYGEHETMTIRTSEVIFATLF